MDNSRTDLDSVFGGGSSINFSIDSIAAANNSRSKGEVLVLALMRSMAN